MPVSLTKPDSVKVYWDRAFVSEPCSDGGRLVVMRRENTPAFVGNYAGAADWLEAQGVDGRGVEVRHPKGVRSCMNKPGLWADLRAMAGDA